MATYSVSEIIDKTLTAKKKVNVYYDKNLTELAETIYPGNVVGIVYSYVIGENGLLIWQLYGANENEFLYTPHAQGNFQAPALAKSQEEIKKELEEANKTFSDKILESGKGLVLTGIAVFAAVEIAKSFIQKPKKIAI